MVMDFFSFFFFFFCFDIEQTALLFVVCWLAVILLLELPT